MSSDASPGNKLQSIIAKRLNFNMDFVKSL